MTTSESSAARNIVNIPIAVGGIDNKFVSKVLNPSFLRESVRYVCGGVTGIAKVKPLYKTDYICIRHHIINSKALEKGHLQDIDWP